MSEPETGPSTTDLPFRTTLAAIEQQDYALPAVSLRTVLVRLILLLDTPHGEVEVRLKISCELFRETAAVKHWLKSVVPMKVQHLLIASGRIPMPIMPMSPFLLTPKGIEYVLEKDEYGKYKNFHA